MPNGGAAMDLGDEISRTSSPAKLVPSTNGSSATLIQPLSVKDKPSSTSAISGDEEAPSPKPEITYLHGTRFYLLTLAVWICIFFANIESSIVSTSLVTITNGFGSFSQADWIVSAYQITYTCFLVIWAKIGDIFGRKRALLSALVLFAVFSGGCGAAQTMNQLIILRSFQGLGASGAFSVSSVMLYEMVPKEKLPIYGALAFTIVALATVVGPLMGGAIDNNTTWKWIFLVNVPSLVIAMILAYVAMPTKFPYHGKPASLESKPKTPLSPSPFFSLAKKIDVTGAVLLLAGAFLLLTALLEASVNFRWSSATIITLLVISAVAWVAFFAWEWYLSESSLTQEPIFSWRFVRNPTWMGMLVSAFCLGVPMATLSIILPQRFQAVNGDSPLEAGIHFLPLMIALPVGSFIGNIIFAVLPKIPPSVFLLAGSAVELIGAGLLITLPSSASGSLPASLYGFQILTGFGAGVVFSILMMVTPRCVEARDLATASSCIVMFRMIGGAIGVAVSGSVVNGRITSSSISSALSRDQVHRLLEDISEISTLPPAQQMLVRDTLAQAFHTCLVFVAVLAGVQLVSMCSIWNLPASAKKQ
ncbi:Multidrug resistance protein 3 [Talaromyces islandicus]|uniref:Multidrug resistance protein 3 n=1 Tax=Talaromyces islandicus TaxID=28573 RepID=A0A0U1M8U3_TALIS|nr:Multidrug resistance protein 3 [Talaromyces islandicus]